MAFPLLAPLIGFGASALGGYLGNKFAGGRSSAGNMGSPQNPQLMQGQGQGGFTSQEMPGGSTAVQTPNFNQDQLGILMQLLSGGASGMQNLKGGDQLPSASFGPIKESAMSDFYQNTVPGIAERFTGAGAGGQRSSAFQQSLGGAGAGLQQRLAAMEQGFNQQERGMGLQERGQDISRLLQMLQMGLQPQQQTNFVEPKQGMMSSMGGGIGQGAGMLAPLLAMKYLG